MKLVGADGWPQRKLYAARAAALVAAFGEAQGLDPHDMALVRPALMGLLHEEAAAHATAWRRIVPAPDGAAHLELLTGQVRSPAVSRRLLPSPAFSDLPFLL